MAQKLRETRNGLCSVLCLSAGLILSEGQAQTHEHLHRRLSCPGITQFWAKRIKEAQKLGIPGPFSGRDSGHSIYSLVEAQNLYARE